MFSIRSSRGHLLLLALVGVVYCYPSYQQRIPNGEVVPHPCNPNHVWEGVGHLARGGGGDRNYFGLDFAANGKKWNRELCMMDSDGDGKTNGMELGDPDCTWTPGQAPKLRTGLSHPGVCEPMDSSICRRQASFVTCENLKFECDTARQADVFNFTVQFPETPVPAQETTYMCMGFEFPQDAEHHMIANVPHIDNINVMHHIVVYGCGADANPNDRPMNQPYNCFMSGKEGCNDIIGLWGVGLLGQCFHEDAGFLVGPSASGYKWAVIEMHWNNPAEESTWTDSSGMTFYLTKNKRPFNAGIIMIGQDYLEIPPGEERYTESGKVTSGCTQQLMTGPVSIVGAVNHMHYLGTAAVSTVLTPGLRSTNIAYDPVYNYDRPVFHTFDNPITVNPGDELELQCHFKSTSRTKTTYKGEDTSTEMCYAFLMYYPRENFQLTSLASFIDVDICAQEQPLIKGCDFNKLYDFSDPETTARFLAVTENCDVHTCRKECKPIVKEIKEHPCYHGTPRKFQASHLQYIEDINTKYNMLQFWSGLDSCDEDLLRDHLRNDLNWDDDETNDTKSVSHSWTLMTSALAMMVSIMTRFQLL